MILFEIDIILFKSKSQIYLIIQAMESEADKFPVIPRPVGLLRDVPSLHEYILRHIATFLDFQSIRQLRLVSREWNFAGTGILMKRGYYDLTYPCHENERSDLYRGAINYSSWKISRSVYQSSELLHENQIWQNVSSLTIHQLIPLFSGFHRWALETIGSRCPNLQELIIIFKPVFNSTDRSRVVSDYEDSIQGLPNNNASFPNEISNLRHLSSVHFKGICEKTTAIFAQNLLQACTNLRHLSFCPIGEPSNVRLDLEAFSIFEYLQNSPSLLKNLHSFAFNIGRYTSDQNDMDSLPICFNFDKKQCELTKFITRNPSPFQFSENLTTLLWDCPFHLDDQFLPGVLTQSLASSLLQLSLNGKVDKVGKTAGKPILFPIKLSFPIFPRLRALKLGLHTAHSLSVPELVDSAPNLRVLELKGLNERVSGPPNELSNSLWRGSDNNKESASHPKHPQLRIFCTDIPCTSLTVIVDILLKFPNLVELRLGRVEGVGLHPFLSFLQSTHPKLQRLSWIYSEKFTLQELFHHLIRLPEQLPALSNYSLGSHFRHCENVQWPDSIQEMEELASILLSLPSKSDSALVINLLLKSLSCNCMSKEESPANDCKQCYLHQFLRSHHLPIRIHSAREIEEVQRKYEWNHRFASCWIYK
jgi:hypothetical protein